MSRLDEMFGEALEREATTPSEEQLAAVADVTVHRARRHRRVRASVEVVAALVVVVAGFVVGASVIAGDATPPVSTPSAPAPSPTVTRAPDLVSALDPRLAQAPAMTQDDWARVTFAWDAEIASFIGGGKDGYGSVFAIYLTPPGGSRMLAYASTDTDLLAPTLLAFDAKTRSVMLSDSPMSGGVRTLNLVTGVWSEVALQLPDPMSGFAPLGKISNGDSLFVVSTVDSQSDYTLHVFRTFDDTAVPVKAGRFDLSPSWEDRLVVIEDGKFSFLDADGTPPPSLDGAEGCGFGVWNTDGSFVAICGATTGRTGEYVRVDPTSGEITTLWEDSAVKDGADPRDALTEFHALDRTRTWSDGLTTSGVPSIPPIIYDDGVQVADLADGFGETPNSYGIIFGVGR